MQAVISSMQKPSLTTVVIQVFKLYFKNSLPEKPSFMRAHLLLLDRAMHRWAADTRPTHSRLNREGGNELQVHGG